MDPVKSFEDALIADGVSTRSATVYHSSPAALREYLREHPNADPKKHQVSNKHKPKARPQRERENAAGRSEQHMKKLKKNLEDDTKALESAKDDAERAEIQRDIDQGKKQIGEQQSLLDKATKSRDTNKRKPKLASAVVDFENALLVYRLVTRFAMDR